MALTMRMTMEDEVNEGLRALERNLERSQKRVEKLGESGVDTTRRFDKTVKKVKELSEGFDNLTKRVKGTSKEVEKIGKDTEKSVGETNKLIDELVKKLEKIPDTSRKITDSVIPIEKEVGKATKGISDFLLKTAAVSAAIVALANPIAAWTATTTIASGAMSAATTAALALQGAVLGTSVTWASITASITGAGAALVGMIPSMSTIAATALQISGATTAIASTVSTVAGIVFPIVTPLAAIAAAVNLIYKATIGWIKAVIDVGIWLAKLPFGWLITAGKIVLKVVSAFKFLAKILFMVGTAAFALSVIWNVFVKRKLGSPILALGKAFINTLAVMWKFGKAIVKTIFLLAKFSVQKGPRLIAQALKLGWKAGTVLVSVLGSLSRILFRVSDVGFELVKKIPDYLPKIVEGVQGITGGLLRTRKGVKQIGDVAKGFFPMIHDALNKLVDLIDALPKKFDEWLGVKSITERLSGFFGATVDKILTGWKKLEEAADDPAKALKKSIVAVFYAPDWVNAVSDTVAKWSESFQDWTGNVKTWAIKAFTTVKQWILNLSAALGELWGKFREDPTMFLSGAVGIFDKIKGVVKTIGDYIANLPQRIRDFVDSADKAKAAVDSLREAQAGIGKEITAVEERMEAAAELASSFARGIIKSKDEVKRLTGEISQAKDELERLREAERFAAGGLLPSAIADALKQDIEAVEKRLKELRAYRLEEKRMIKWTEGAIEKLTQEIQNSYSDIAALERAIEAFGKAIEQALDPTPPGRYVERLAAVKTAVAGVQEYMQRQAAFAAGSIPKQEEAFKKVDDELKKLQKTFERAKAANAGLTAIWGAAVDVLLPKWKEFRDELEKNKKTAEGAAKAAEVVGAAAAPIAAELEIPAVKLPAGLVNSLVDIFDKAFMVLRTKKSFAAAATAGFSDAIRKGLRGIGIRIGARIANNITKHLKKREFISAVVALVQASVVNSVKAAVNEGKAVAGRLEKAVAEVAQPAKRQPKKDPVVVGAIADVISNLKTAIVTLSSNIANLAQRPTGGAAALPSFENLERMIANNTTEISKLTQVVGSKMDALISGLTSAVDYTQLAKAFENLIKRILDQLTRIKGYTEILASCRKLTGLLERTTTRLIAGVSRAAPAAAGPTPPPKPAPTSAAPDPRGSSQQEIQAAGEAEMKRREAAEKTSKEITKIEQKRFDARVAGMEKLQTAVKALADNDIAAVKHMSKRMQQILGQLSKTVLAMIKGWRFEELIGDPTIVDIKKAREATAMLRKELGKLGTNLPGLSKMVNNFAKSLGKEVAGGTKKAVEGASPGLKDLQVVLVKIATVVTKADPTKLGKSMAELAPQINQAATAVVALVSGTSPGGLEDATVEMDKLGKSSDVTGKKVAEAGGRISKAAKGVKTVSVNVWEGLPLWVKWTVGIAGAAAAAVGAYAAYKLLAVGLRAVKGLMLLPFKLVTGGFNLLRSVVGGAINGLKRLGSSLGEIIRNFTGGKGLTSALKLTQLRLGKTREEVLALSASIGKALGPTASLRQQMAALQQARKLNIVDEDAIKLAEFAEAQARATGRTVIEVNQEVTQAFAEGNADQLAQLGMLRGGAIRVAAEYDKLAGQVGAFDKLGEAFKKQVVQQKALAAGAQEVKWIEEIGVKGHDIWTRLKAVLAEVVDKFNLMVGSMKLAGDTAEGTNDIIDTIKNTMLDWLERMPELINWVANLARKFALKLLDIIGKIGNALQALTQSTLVRMVVGKKAANEMYSALVDISKVHAQGIELLKDEWKFVREVAAEEEQRAVKAISQENERIDRQRQRYELSKSLLSAESGIVSKVEELRKPLEGAVSGVNRFSGASTAALETLQRMGGTFTDQMVFLDGKFQRMTTQFSRQGQAAIDKISDAARSRLKDLATARGEIESTAHRDRLRLADELAKKQKQLHQEMTNRLVALAEQEMDKTQRSMKQDEIQRKHREKVNALLAKQQQIEKSQAIERERQLKRIEQAEKGITDEVRKRFEIEKKREKDLLDRLIAIATGIDGAVTAAPGAVPGAAPRVEAEDKPVKKAMEFGSRMFNQQVQGIRSFFDRQVGTWQKQTGTQEKQLTAEEKAQQQFGRNVQDFGGAVNRFGKVGVPGAPGAIPKVGPGRTPGQRAEQRENVAKIKAIRERRSLEEQVQGIVLTTKGEDRRRIAGMARAQKKADTLRQREEQRAVKIAQQAAKRGELFAGASKKSEETLKLAVERRNKAAEAGMDKQAELAQKAVDKAQRRVDAENKIAAIQKGRVGTEKTTEERAMDDEKTANQAKQEARDREVKSVEKMAQSAKEAAEALAKARERLTGGPEREAEVAARRKRVRAEEREDPSLAAIPIEERMAMEKEFQEARNALTAQAEIDRGMKRLEMEREFHSARMALAEARGEITRGEAGSHTPEHKTAQKANKLLENILKGMPKSEGGSHTPEHRKEQQEEKQEKRRTQRQKREDMERERRERREAREREKQERRATTGARGQRTKREAREKERRERRTGVEEGPTEAVADGNGGDGVVEATGELTGAFEALSEQQGVADAEQVELLGTLTGLVASQELSIQSLQKELAQLKMQTGVITNTRRRAIQASSGGMS